MVTNVTEYSNGVRAVFRTELWQSACCDSNNSVKENNL
jgi:hypothetical protein